MFNTVKALVVAALTATVVAGSALSASAQSMVEEVVQRGTLRVGMATFVPRARSTSSC